MKKISLRPLASLALAAPLASCAVEELESILRMMQGDGCDVDQLVAYTRRAPNTRSSPKDVFTFHVRTGFRLMSLLLKHGNGGCFGFVPNFLDLFSLQLFDPYTYVY